MCKRVLTSGLSVLILCVVASNLAAQPNVGAYFCGSGTELQDQQVCQGVGVIDTLCVVVQNPGCATGNIEFAISYPPSITWLMDFDTQLAVGTTPTGFQMFWPADQPPGQVFVCHVLIRWNCDSCIPPGNEPMQVIPHPGTGFLGSTSCGPLQILVPMTGLTSVVCPTVPVHETTWGQVKALYSLR